MYPGMDQNKTFQMNWTSQDAIRFHDWECQMMAYNAHKRIYPESTELPPAKPLCYDLWKYGPELPAVEAVPCKGGELVDDTWRRLNER
jgi:hypothetical protein